MLCHRALWAGSADFAHEMDIGRYKGTVRYLSERDLGRVYGREGERGRCGGQSLLGNGLSV